MKLQQLKKIVKKWQDKLNLRSWHIQTKWASKTKVLKEGMQDCDAWVQYDENMLEATIWVTRGALTPWEELMIHELLHLHLWPIEDKVRQEQAVEAIVKVLKPK